MGLPVQVRMFLLAVVVCVSLSAQTTATVVVTVDASQNRHAIDPHIYGVAYATPLDLLDLNVPLHRWGGNATTRYNWQLNASNRASDWYFESIGENTNTPGNAVDLFINDSVNAGAEPMITIPIIGWAAKLGPNREKLASFSVKKYGAQQKTDPYFPDAGNGVKTDGTFITNNDPTDANQAVEASFQQQWVRQIVQKWHGSGVRYYLLDNEPSIWHVTHRDVHPAGARMEEVLTRMLAHADAIKAEDPDALVGGPEEWGWTGYFYSGYDQQWGAANGWASLPDRMEHSNTDYIPWLLQKFREHDTTTGNRHLDILTVHWYPQGGEFSDDVTQTMQAKRNRSTRSLWDVNYVDESWIGQRVSLIPRLRNWVNVYYPGTKIGITEYNWGAENDMNGGTAQADVLGIFGRERLDFATRWTTPAGGTPAYYAFKMYRNYDNRRSTFGDVSINTIAPKVDEVSAFAAIRTTDSALTVMLINKTAAKQNLRVDVSNFQLAQNVQVYQFESGLAIGRMPDVKPTNQSLSLSVPARSVTLLVVPAGSSIPQSGRRRIVGRQH